MNNNLQGLKEFIAALDEGEQSEDMIHWIEEVCAPKGDISMVHQLIVAFLGNLEDVIFANSILKCLSKLDNWVPEIVKPQLLSDPLFPRAIVEYLSKTDINQFVSDGFVLLAQIFNQAQFKPVATSKFIQVLFDSLEYVDNQEIFKQLVMIIVNLYEISIEVAIKHPNQRYFSEFLVQYLNKTDQVREIGAIVQFNEHVLTRSQGFFYENDFKILQEISLRQIQDGDEVTRQLFIRNTYILVSAGNKKLLLRDQIIETMNTVLECCKDKYSLKKAKQVLDQFK